MHWSYIFLALSYQYIEWDYWNDVKIFSITVLAAYMPRTALILSPYIVDFIYLNLA